MFHLSFYRTITQLSALKSSILLSNSQAGDLVNYLNPIIDRLTDANDLNAGVSLTGAVLAFTFQASKIAHPLVGVGVSSVSAAVNFTLGDLVKVRDALQTELDNDSDAIALTIGENSWNWGIMVNGEKAVGHNSMRSPLGIFFPRVFTSIAGELNVSREVINYWVNFEMTNN